MKSRKIGLHQFMAVPAFALYAVFFIYPLLKGIGLCFTDWDGIKAAHFVGLGTLSIFFMTKGHCRTSGQPYCLRSEVPHC